jgi:hypothetical protein
LNEPIYIIVRRGFEDIATSMLERGPSKYTHSEWVQIAKAYMNRVNEFVTKFNPTRVEVRFENLILSNTAKQEVRKLAAAVVAKAIPLAMKEIHFR